MPGISFSPDKMLQARIFAYADAHRYRVGTHFEAFPVNAPKNAVNTYHADGSMRFDKPKRTDAFFEPNSFGGPVQDPSAKEPPLHLSGDADRYDHRERLYANIAAAMNAVPHEIQARRVGHFRKCDPAYGEGVAKAIGHSATGISSAPTSTPERELAGATGE